MMPDESKSQEQTQTNDAGKSNRPDLPYAWEKRLQLAEYLRDTWSASLPSNSELAELAALIDAIARPESTGSIAG